MDRTGPADEETFEPWDDAWVETEALDRWQPPVGQRVRAAVILLGALGVLALLAVVMTLAPGGGDDDAERAVADDTSTTADIEITTPSTMATTAPQDPASVAGAPPPERCADDDRGALDLRPLPEIEVEVLNATPRGGHAGEVTDAIARLGYRTATPGNAGREPVTVIRHTSGWCAEADRLAAELRLPGAALEAVPRGEERDFGTSDLVVVVGADSL